MIYQDVLVYFLKRMIKYLNEESISDEEGDRAFIYQLVEEFEFTKNDRETVLEMARFLQHLHSALTPLLVRFFT